MKPKRYMPRNHKRWSLDQHHSRVAHFYMEEGVVEVYSFPGDSRSAAFTNLEMWISPHVYRLTLPRQYHDRWLRRLAGDFAYACKKQAKKESPR